MTDAVTNIKVIGQIRAIVKDFSENRAGQQVLLDGVPRVGETISDRMWSATVNRVCWYAQPHEYDVLLEVTRTTSEEWKPDE